MAEEIIINYRAFLKTLDSELESLRKSGSFSGLCDMTEIIYKISQMQTTKFIPRTAITLRYSENSIKEELKRFFDPFFKGFDGPSELLEHIKRESCDYFTMQKAYQLSHARGIWRAQIERDEEIDKDIKNYFLSRIFTDYYETLPLILNPILRYHWSGIGEPISKFPKNVFEQYQFLGRFLGDSIFHAAEVDEEFRKLRNELSHSSVLFKGNHVFVLERQKEAKKRHPLHVFPLMEVMMNLLVIYATEIDLRIMSLAKPENDHLFNSWMEYFENYVHWFHKNFTMPSKK